MEKTDKETGWIDRQNMEKRDKQTDWIDKQKEENWQTDILNRQTQNGRDFEKNISTFLQSKRIKQKWLFMAERKFTNSS